MPFSDDWPPGMRADLPAGRGSMRGSRQPRCLQRAQAAVILALGLLLAACTARGIDGRDSTPTPIAPPSTPTPTASANASSGGPAQCYYEWARQDLPELSTKFQAAIDAAGLEAQAGAYAFGENCRAADGTSTFLAMETDFRIRVRVDAVSDEEALGNAISASMTAIMSLPASELAGPKPGRAEFEFVSNASEILHTIVEISRYRDEAGGLSGASLFRHFRTQD